MINLKPQGIRILQENKELVKSLQRKILLFLSVTNYASWHILKRNIRNLVDSEPSNIINPEYQVIYPLLRTGFIETARNPETGKLVYCLGSNAIIQTPCENLLKITTRDFHCEIIEKNNEETYPIISKDASLFILKNIPPLKEVILHWIKSEVLLQFIYNRFNKNHFIRAKETVTPNIYSHSNFFYSNKYLKTKEELYLIPSIEDNIDAMNIALCYLQVINERCIFNYNPLKETITSAYFDSILPFLICRALLLCDPMILLNEIHFENSITIKYITKKHITELKRIFGENAVREKNE